MNSGTDLTLAGALVVVSARSALIRASWETARSMSRSRAVLAVFFAYTGTMHFVKPRFFEAIVPPAIGSLKKQAVAVSGVAEIAGAAAVLHPATRRCGRWWLLGLLLAVFPANIHMAVNPEQIEGLDLKRIPRWALWARLPLQPLAMLWVWRATRS
jgi:uncharacterized membrane protein